MTTKSNAAAILKDVVAYVDVWSSSKTENYSEPFIHQLLQMGAEVSKTFSKQVTHVVFKHGRQSTWNKAKSTGAKLVSVLWVDRCRENSEHVDEDLFPAVNEESKVTHINKRTHRCMQPRDIPVRTPENDKRLKRKLDRMVGGLISSSPVVSDTSPLIIDEENGIVYSPSSRRADTMAQRLREMREKRENLSPTASQMVESRLSLEASVKPSLGSTPAQSFTQLLDEEESDITNPHSESPEKKDKGMKQHSDAILTIEPVTDKRTHKTDILGSFESSDNLAKQNTPSPPKKRPRRSSVRSGGAKKQSSLKSFFHNAGPVMDKSSEFKAELDNKSQEQSGKSCDKSEKTKSNFPSESALSRTKTKLSKTIQTRKETQAGLDHFSKSLSYTSSTSVTSKETQACLGNVSKSLNCASSTSVTECSEGQCSFPDSSEFVPKVSHQRKKAGVSQHTSVGFSNVSPHTEDDSVFEDYFSPANNTSRCRTLLLKSASELKHLPSFELEPVSGKQAWTKSNSNGPPSRKRKLKVSGEEQSFSQMNTAAKPNDILLDHKTVPAVSKSEEQKKEPASKKLKTRSKQNSLTLSEDNEAKRLLNDSAAGGKKLSADGSFLSAHGFIAAKGEPKAVRNAKPQPPPKQNETIQKAVQILGEGNKNAVDGLSERSSEMGSKKRTMTMDKYSKAKRTLVMTSMPTEKQHTVLQVVNSLGGFTVVDTVCESTTHVVTGSPRRTLNVLLGIARGCWILSFEWILWCLEHGQWIPEEPYELSDHFPAAPICRLQQHLSAGEHQQDLFQGQPVMFVSPLSQPPSQSLAELIQLCGGTLSRSVRQAGICIGEYKGKRPEGTRSLSEQWVLDCVTHLTLLPYENYDLDWRSQ